MSDGNQGDRRRRARLGRLLRVAPLGVVAGIGAAVVCIGGPAVAGAATTPVTPTSLTECAGTLAGDPSGASQDEPYLTDYAFHCDTPITAYTVTVDRAGAGYSNLDNYSPSASVVELNGVTSSTESFTCGGTTPSNGINCNAGAGGFMDAYASAEGSIDLVAPYCKSLPAKAKPGTLALPQALVSVVVTDNTGAEDGPFYIGPTKACPKVPNVVPQATTKKKSKKSKK